MSMRIDIRGSAGSGKTRLAAWLANNLPAWAGDVDIVDDPASYCHVTSRPTPVSPLTAGDGQVAYRPTGNGEGQQERKIEIARNLLMMVDLIVAELWRHREINEHGIGALVSGRIAGPIQFICTFKEGMTSTEGFLNMDLGIKLGHLVETSED